MRSDHAVRLKCRSLSLPEVRALPALPSGYATDRVFRLERASSGDSITWNLSERRLDRELHKQYDAGRADDWLPSYADAGPPDELRFIGAFRGEEVLGLMTWRLVEWNYTVWLVDVRVRSDTRRSGVGSALVRRLQNECRRNRARGISVETQINNYPAISFYRKHGFHIAGFNDCLYTNDDFEEQDVALFLFCKI